MVNKYSQKEYFSVDFFQHTPSSKISSDLSKSCFIVEISVGGWCRQSATFLPRSWLMKKGVLLSHLYSWLASALIKTDAVYNV